MLRPIGPRHGNFDPSSMIQAGPSTSVRECETAVKMSLSTLFKGLRISHPCNHERARPVLSILQAAAASRACHQHVFQDQLECSRPSSRHHRHLTVCQAGENVGRKAANIKRESSKAGANVSSCPLQPCMSTCMPCTTVHVCMHACQTGTHEHLSLSLTAWFSCIAVLYSGMLFVYRQEAYCCLASQKRSRMACRSMPHTCSVACLCCMSQVPWLGA